MTAGVPPYFDYLIEGFRRGESGRFVHLGHWDETPTRAELDTPGEFLRAQTRLNEKLLQLAALADDLSILDVGCGFGGTLARINDTHTGMRLHGLNIDPRQLEICRSVEARADNDLQWHEGEASRLPMADGAFDRVLSIEAMFHFPSRGAFLAEAARVLRPGGLVVVSDIIVDAPPPNAATPPYPLIESLQTGFGPWPDPCLREGGLEQVGAQAGLELESLVDATAATVASHYFTLPSSADDDFDPGDDSMRAAMALRWLHRNGCLKYPYLRFRKPAA